MQQELGLSATPQANDRLLDLGLDSLGRYELAAIIEELSGGQIDDEELGAMATVGDVLRAAGLPGL